MRKTHRSGPAGRSALRTGNVYLIGIMGSGKSSVGRALGRRLNWEFISTDRMIEKTAGRSISDIFALGGETLFRKLENKAVANAARKSRRVIAVGGGAVVNKDNSSVMRRTGTLVYLQISPKIALRRAEREGIAARPLLAQHPFEDRLSVMRGILNLRRPLYLRRANIRIRAGLGSPTLIAERIARKL